MRYRLLTLLLFLIPAPAMAACLMLTLANVPSVVTFQGASGGYAVFDPAEYLQTVNFRVQGEATGATCDYFVTLSAGQSGNLIQRKLMLDMHTLNYNAYTNAGKSNILKDNSGTQSEVIAGSFPLPTGVNLVQSNDHNFVWTVDPLQAVPASATPYSDPALTLRLYSGLLTGIIAPTLEDTKTITFQARADSSVDVSLVDSGAPFDISDTVQVIDFNTLESGEQRGFDVVVRSNNGYRVTLQSENNQRMVHERAPAIADAIDYTVTLNGAEIDLTSGAPTDAAISTGTTTAAGARLPIEFTIGNMTGAETGGIYSDVINVEVTAN